VKSGPRFDTKTLFRSVTSVAETLPMIGKTDSEYAECWKSLLASLIMDISCMMLVYRIINIFQMEYDFLC